MPDKKVLVIGGKGYVGSLLVDRLQRKGYNVFVYDRPNDILDKHKLEAVIKTVDVVYHLAALAEINYTDAHPEETYDINVTGTRNVVEACAKYDVLLNFISTCCIYGEPLQIPSQEDGMINPTDYYATTKAAGEWIVKGWALSKELRYNILRLGTVYGPSTDKNMRPDMCIQIFLDKVRKRERLTIFGTGKQVRNFIHIEDAVAGFIAVLEKGGQGETFNIGGAEEISVLDIAHIALKLGGMPEDSIDYKSERKDDFSCQYISLGKSLKILGWRPRIRFESGMKDFYEWLGR